MAFKLPLFAKHKKETATQGGDANSAVPTDANLQADAHVADIPVAPITRANVNPNATYIGDVLQKSGDISLPLIGKLPLQQQVRILLIALGSSLALGAIFVWLNADSSALTSTQTQIAGDALMHSQRVGKATPNAIQGNKEAFKQLADSRKEFNNDLAILSKGCLLYTSPSPRD